MKNTIKALIVGILILTSAIITSAGDVVVQDGGMNLSAKLLVNKNTLYVDSNKSRVGIGITNPSFKLDVEDIPNALTDAKFGSNKPIYISHSSPSIGFNIYYDGSSWRYGKGSASNYASLIYGDPGSGGITFATWSNSGNAYGSATGFGDRMIIDKNGNVGIGTTSPAAKLDINGAIKANNHLTHLPWKNFNDPPNGYIKLSTPIVHNESNMFSLRIFGYEYTGGSDPIDIQCVGYAYSATTLINTKCQTEGTDLAVEIGTETRTEQGGKTVVVIRLGTPTWDWYYPQLTAEYIGWKAKSEADFKWVTGEITPNQTGNTNNVVINDQTGNSWFNTRGNVGIGLTNPRSRLHVNAPSGQYANDGSKPTMLLSYAGTTYANHYIGGSWDYFIDNPYNSTAYGGIHIKTAGTERLTISKGGNIGIGTTSPNATLTIKVGGTTIADSWDVRSDRDLEDGITELNVDSFDISSAKIYKYRLRHEEVNPETNQIVQKLTEERIGLMWDEVPDECRTSNNAVDTYCLLSILYAKLAKLEEDIADLKK